MKGFRALACVLLISLPVLGYSGTLVVSQDLALEYPEPELISHSSNMLILKYAPYYRAGCACLRKSRVGSLAYRKGK